MGPHEDRADARRIGGRELGLALALYVGFLALAVTGSYARGPGLLRQVIWDPVTLFTFYPGEQTVLRSLREGFFPLWDASRGLGSPHVIPNGLTWSFPLKWVIYAFDSDRGWELYLLLRFLAAGMFCYLSARAAGLSPRGARLAGLVYMLTGYFREYQNQESMNVELLFPLIFYGLTMMERRRTLAAVLATMLVCSVSNCQPESAICAASYLACYFVMIWWLRPSFAAGWAKRLAGPVLITGMGFTLALLVAWDATLSFIEYVHRGWVFHPKGLGELVFPLRNAVALVTPLLDYWLSSRPNLPIEHLEQLSLVPAYLGTVTVALALTALARVRRLPAAGVFFAVAALVVGGMIFGVPPFRLLLRLPLVRYFQNFRYLQPFLAHAMACLAGFGLEQTLRSRTARRLVMGISAALGLWIGAQMFSFRHEVLASALTRWGLMAGSLLAVLIAAGTAGLMWRRPARRPAVLAGALLLAAGLELSLYFNLATPVFGPGAFSIAPPPVVQYLRGLDPQAYRMVGLDQRIIHPNLAGLWGLSDLRDHVPLEVGDYARLMAAADGLNSDDELIRHFLAEGKFYFDLDWARWPRGLSGLLNVKYVLAQRTPGWMPLSVSPARGEVTAKGREYVAEGEIEAEGITRQAVFLSSPARLTVPLGDGPARRMRFDAAVLDKARACRDADGIMLAMFAEQGGTKRLAWARAFASAGEGGWRTVESALPAGAGRLAMAITPGPRNDPRCDFGAIGAPDLTAADAPDPAAGLRVVYDQEVRVYEDSAALPLVHPVLRLERAADLAAFLAAVRTGDPRTTAWTASALDRLGDYGGADVSGLRRGPGRLEFRARSESKAYLVIAQLDYPGGWRAWSGGHELRLDRVNAVLQGLALPAGEHEIIMAYAPASFRIGIWFRLASFAALFAIVLARRGRWGQAG